MASPGPGPPAVRQDLPELEFMVLGGDGGVVTPLWENRKNVREAGSMVKVQKAKRKGNAHWRAKAFLVFLLILFAGAATAQGTLAPSNQTLRRRIGTLEQALSFKKEGLGLAEKGDVPGAMEALAKSLRLYPDQVLEEKMASFRPDLRELKEKIDLLESLLAVERLITGGDLVSPVPDEGIPPPELDFPEKTDNPDWRSYSDFPVEKAAVEKALGGFRAAMKAGDVQKAVMTVDESRRETYGALFAHKPEAMASFADLLEKGRVSFFSAPEDGDPRTTSTLRTMEYALDVDGFTFYLRWIKAGGQWLLFDF